MLTFILVWTFLLINCLIIGDAVISLLSRNSLKSSVDSCFLSIWAGLSLLLGLLMIVSLLIPLSTISGLIAIIFVSLSCLAIRKYLTNASKLFHSWSGKETLIILALTLLVALFMNQTIEWFDTGLYHLGLINWISKHGIVPGLALVNGHFAKASAWFTFSAPLLLNFSQNRVGAVSNGFILLLACLQLILSLNSIKLNCKPVSLFVISFLTLYIANLLFFQPLFTTWNLPIVVSFSPDVPVNLFVGIVAWSILLIADENGFYVFPPTNTNRIKRINLRIIPLVIASAVVAIKVTAFPLVVVSALFYLVEDYRDPWRWLISASIPLGFCIPFFAHGIIASGCPLPPSQFMCLDVPWAMSVEKAAAELQRVTGGVYTDAGLFKKWFDLIQKFVKMRVLLALILVSGVSSICLIFFSLRRASSRAKIYFTLGIAWSGIAFLLAVSTVQILRFGFSYFLLIPCLLFSIVGYRQSLNSSPIQFPILRNRHFLTSLGMLSLVASLIVSYSYRLSFQTEFSWFLYPALPTPMQYRIYTDHKDIKVTGMVSQETNNIVFTYPSAGNPHICWSLDILVCSKPKETVHLRRPTTGFAGGFINKDPSVTK